MASAFFRSSAPMAGLSLESGVIRYVELEGGIGNLKLVRKGEISTETGVIQQDMVSDYAALEQSLNSLKSQIGGHWPRQAVIGIPPRDVLIRVVELPSMPTQDAREAFKWEFDKYFPFSSLEATFDLAPVILPSKEEGSDKSRFIVAATRTRTIDRIVETAKRAGLTAGPVEPTNLAIYRSAVGPLPPSESGHLLVSIGRESTQVIMGYRGDGFLYRTFLVGGAGKTPSADAFSAIVREAVSTIAYTRSQYRNLNIDRIFLSGEFGRTEGLPEQLEQASGLPVSVLNPWDTWGIPAGTESPAGYDAAIGLALRDVL